MYVIKCHLSKTRLPTLNLSFFKEAFSGFLESFCIANITFPDFLQNPESVMPVIIVFCGTISDFFEQSSRMFTASIRDVVQPKKLSHLLV